MSKFHIKSCPQCGGSHESDVEFGKVVSYICEGEQVEVELGESDNYAILEFLASKRTRSMNYVCPKHPGAEIGSIETSENGVKVLCDQCGLEMVEAEERWQIE